ncbi:MAG: hypothetical protein CME63_05470 [Halobacteriovoraceae bacterium]|nr:hypothetical protein [Halobacteriovoraceae bacterium]|tara:strand:+ start:109572 stop:110081 length:510 start_codon:yes stop_codon:yes gene_type:complete
MAKKSLKEQLMEAGFRSNKMENHRQSAKGREIKQSEKHQVTRNFCEHCSLIHPDVERYKHNMPTTEAEWICLVCADKLMIDDRFRVTQQSDMSKKKMFKRYFGQTKDFSKEPQGRGSRIPGQKRANGNVASRPNRNDSQRSHQGRKNKPNHQRAKNYSYDDDGEINGNR